MNVKLHTPKTLKAGSGLNSAKQFFLSIVATTISIVLTFGTAAVLDHQKKESAKKEMVMMVLSDFDKTIEAIQRNDSVLREASRLQLELAAHPEYYDSLCFSFNSAFALAFEDFPETIERIFSTSIETFNTIGDVNFVNEVSNFYLNRQQYQDLVIQKIKEDLEQNPPLQSYKSLMNVNFPEHVFINWLQLENLKRYRDKCMEMMNISEKDLSEFTKRHTSEKTEIEQTPGYQQMLEEFSHNLDIINEAREKYGN